MVNTRMKDFYDLCILALEFEFSGPVLCKAIETTFERRNTEIPSTVPVALTEDFFGDQKKAKQWSAFVSKSGLNFQDSEFASIIAVLKKFLLPPLNAIRESKPFEMHWAKNGPWTPSTLS
jgi:Nucleotidyl transferase AbiEii toxin, Type IV TA system